MYLVKYQKPVVHYLLSIKQWQHIGYLIQLINQFSEYEKKIIFLWNNGSDTFYAGFIKMNSVIYTEYIYTCSMA